MNESSKFCCCRLVSSMRCAVKTIMARTTNPAIVAQIIKMTNFVLGDPFDGGSVVVVVSGDDVSNSMVVLLKQDALVKVSHEHLTLHSVNCLL